MGVVSGDLGGHVRYYACVSSGSPSTATAPPVSHTASVKKGLGLAEVTIYMYITGGPVSLLPLQPEGPPPDPSLPGHDRLGLSTARSGCTG